MRRLTALLLIVGIVLTAGVSLAQSQSAPKNAESDGLSIVTVYLVRHAEKDESDPTDRDPPLTAEGRQRADRLAAMLSSVTIDSALSTPLERTLSTAQPVIDGRGLEIKSYGPGEIVSYANRIARGELGDVVFVSGHSNTTPDFVEALGGPALPDLGHDEYDALFVVTIAVENGKPGAASAQKLHF